MCVFFKRGLLDVSPFTWSYNSPSPPFPKDTFSQQLLNFPFIESRFVPSLSPVFVLPPLFSSTAHCVPHTHNRVRLLSVSVTQRLPSISPSIPFSLSPYDVSSYKCRPFFFCVSCVRLKRHCKKRH